MAKERRETVALPTAEEIEKITPIIKEVFAKHNIRIEKLGPNPYGGIVAEARIPIGKISDVRNALFVQGIVLVSVQAGWGFAVRR